MSDTFRSTKGKNNNIIVFYFLSLTMKYYIISVRLNYKITCNIHVNNSLFEYQIVVTKITHEEKAERESKQKADSSE